MTNTKKVLALAAASASVMIAGAGAANAASSTAVGNADHSPGVVSGNTIQVPISIPVNLCGDTVNIIAALNPAAGNACVND
jgi:hypothetical protein